MEVKAISKHNRVSAQKLRRVVNLIRDKKINDALSILSFLPNGSSKLVYKTLKSAVANATNNANLHPEKLAISRILVNEGPSMKRFSARARGRADMIKKRTSHLTVCVKEI